MDDVAVELLLHAGSRSTKALPDSGVHQSVRLPFGVELAALVVEAVGELVAHHHADGAEVHRVGRPRVSKNGGWRMPAGKTISFIGGS